MLTTQFDILTLDPAVVDFYKSVLRHLQESRIPFLAGGGFAFGLYTGIVRDTKDFDIFVKPSEVERLLEIFTAAGFRTEMTDRRWIAKIFSNGYYVDIIFAFRNQLAVIDEKWFEHARQANMFGFDLRIVPPEELLWSKCFVATRERYDGADIAHLLLRQADHFDWTRLVARFGDHWRLLYANLILFGYVYPSHQHLIPDYVLEDLEVRLQSDEPASKPRAICRGPLLSPTDYSCDIDAWGFVDPLSE